MAKNSIDPKLLKYLKDKNLIHKDIDQGVIKKSEPELHQRLVNLSNEWNRNKPQLMKDIPLTDLTIGPLLDYVSGQSDVPPMPIGTVKSPQSYRAGDFKSSIPDNEMKRLIRDYKLEKAPEYSTKETKELLQQVKDRLSTPEGIKRLKNLNREKFNVDDIKLIKDNTDYGYSTKTLTGKKIIGLNENLPKQSIKNITRHELEHQLQGGNPTEIDELLKNLELRITPNVLENNGYSTVEKTKDVPGYNVYDMLSNKKNATDYFHSGSAGKEKSAMLSELQQYLIDNKYISHPYAVNEITPQKIKDVYVDRMFKENDYPLRIFDIMKTSENNYKLISEGLNKMISTVPVGVGLGAYKLNENDSDMNERKFGGWIQKAVNPKHRGFCSPMTKSTCTPRRKAFAMTMKKHHGFNAEGGYINNITNEDYSNLMFLGGNTHDNTNTNMIGGAAQLGVGIGTGNPAAIASGATGFVSGNIKNMSTVLKDKDSSILEKGLSLVSPIAGGIFANAARDRESSWNEANDAIKERNKMFNIKAKGGFILPLGVQSNMAMNYDDGGKLLTEFNNGKSHEENPFGGVPQGSDNQGNPNLVEEGETKFDNYIFSDRLKLDESTVSEHNLPKSMTGKTFAEASKRINKLYKERPNDAITKSTAKDYLTRLTSANDKARSIDEQNNMMAYGGHMYYGGGGIVGRTYFDKNGNELLSGRVGNEFFKPGLNQKIQVPKLEVDKLKAKADSIAANNKKVPSFFSDTKNLRYAPIAFDVLASTGLFGKTPTPKTTSPTLIQNQGMLSPQAIDEMQARKLVDEAYQTGVSGLSEASGGSGSALRASLMGLTSDYASSLGKTFTDVNRANIAQKQAADQFNLQTQGNLASQNAQIINQSDLYNNLLLNAKDQADYENRMSYLGKAAEGLGDVGYESRLGEILPKIYGYDQYGNYTAKLKKCGGRLRLKSYKK